ncbi:hypothetical protein [Streptomyces sp. NPDC002994]|uniref:hypothetical protein n=1 Tax=Streptomyces sp. NPDC002994 TaxID=3154441 RepID=UPI0033BD6945
MSARRPLLTATAAGTLLCALWFVPSANATAEKEAKPQPATQPQSPSQLPPGESAPHDLALADTGSVDTTPYLIGGTTFLTLGAGFLAYSMRRAAHQII